MCNYKDQNINKIMKLQIWSFAYWHFIFEVLLFETSNFSFLKSKNFIVEIAEYLLEML